MQLQPVSQIPREVTDARKCTGSCREVIRLHASQKQQHRGAAEHDRPYSVLLVAVSGKHGHDTCTSWYQCSCVWWCQDTSL